MSRRVPGATGDTALDRRNIIWSLTDTFVTDGRVPRSAYVEAATRLGITVRQVRRLVSRCAKDGWVPSASDRGIRKPLTEVEGLDPTDLLISELIHHNGNVTAVWKSLGLDGKMTLRTLQRRVEALPKIFRAAASDGYRGAVKFGLYSTIHVPCRGYLFSMDHSQLPIQALPERGSQPVWVWFTSVDLSDGSPSSREAHETDVSRECARAG